MSYVSTYDRRTPKPKGIAWTLGVHAMVIGAVIAMPGIEIIPDEKTDVEAIFISMMEPIEEKIEEQEREIKVPQKAKIQSPVPQIDDLPKAPQTKITNFSGSEELSFGGGGAGDIPFEPLDDIIPTPDRVTVAARLNPRFAKQFQPRYPSGLLRRDIEGNVSVRVLVGTDGRAKDIELISAPHPEFWETTRKHALRKWRFQPATKDGSPIESWISLKVRFEINS
ncbi:MAG: hypothetical protein Pars2KO_10340 [Parasphingorhabdus sp.]